MKKIFLFLSAFALTTIMMGSCKYPINTEKPDEPQDSIPVELQSLKQSVVVTDNWIFESKPTIVVHVENPNAVAVDATVKATISTDLKKAVTTIEQTVSVAANSSLDVTLTTPEDLAPGFYRANCIVNKKSARSFVFGISPTEIVSAPDKQPDFDEYWAAAKEQLEAIDMDPQLTLLEKKSTDKRKIYLVELQSVPDGPEGEPVTVRGYYAEPQDGQKHPVIMHFYGYDSQNATSWPPCPGGNDSEFAEFFFSIRGQMLNNRAANHRYNDGKEEDFVNIYGDWFAYNFGVKDGYYYRGAFMDCVQAVRFMATRESSDMTQLFAEGSSQGGALSYAVAALSDYPFTAIAPCVAFLGDFPDYFHIVGWPAETAKANQGSMTDEEMYAFLSYFDTKNLATRISAAVIACSGLQDGTCPPHTNLAPYNNLQTEDKVIYYYPEMGHEIPADWTGKFMKFFRERMK